MKDKKIFEEAMLSDEELDNVAGGTRYEFEDICKMLGKSPTFNTKNGTSNILEKNYGIEVKAWNTGDNGAKNDLAEFYRAGTDKRLSFEDVKRIIIETW